MAELNKIKFSDFKKYLTDNYIFGFTVRRRKHTLIYTMHRYLPSYGKNVAVFYVKVMKTSRFIMSVRFGDKIYTTLESLKPIIEKKK